MKYSITVPADISTDGIEHVHERYYEIDSDFASTLREYGIIVTPVED